MMGKPADISLTDIKIEIEAIPEVKNLHHVHLWTLTDNLVHFEAHIDIKDMPVSDTEKLLENIEEKLFHNYKINHTTIQFETDKCISKELVNDK